MKKGITPIVAIIILLLITIAIAGTAWSFLFGYITPMTATTFTIAPGGAFCVKNASGADVITVQISNNGQSTLTPGEFTIVEVGGTDIKTAVTLLPDGSIAPGESGILFRDYDCGNSTTGCSPGSIVVTVSTASTVIHQPVNCP